MRNSEERKNEECQEMIWEGVEEGGTEKRRAHGKQEGVVGVK